MDYENLKERTKEIMGLIKEGIEKVKAENGELSENAISLNDETLAYLFSEINMCDYDTLKYLDLSNFDFKLLNKNNLGDGMKQKIVSMMREDSLNNEKKYSNLYLSEDFAFSMMPELLEGRVDFFSYLEKDTCVTREFFNDVLWHVFQIVGAKRPLLKEGERIQFNSSVLNRLFDEIGYFYFKILPSEDKYLFRYIDLSEVCFDNRDVREFDFSNCNVVIDPQKVRDRDLYGTNLENVDMSLYDFTDVDVRAANLKGTKAHVDPQKVYDKSLENTILEGLDMSEYDFTYVSICGTNLKGTKAHVDPQTVIDMDISYANLIGTVLLNHDYTDVEMDGTIFDDGQSVLDDINKVFNKLNVKK